MEEMIKDEKAISESIIQIAEFAGLENENEILIVIISGIHSNSSPEEKWHCTTARNFQRKTISNNMTYAHLPS
jgi:hypothetical protein